MADKWYISALSSMRDSVGGGAEIIAAAATVLAAFFIVAKMVGFHYKLSSDEQSGGFGGVKAWDFIKPIVLLLLIGLSPNIGKTINHVMTECMDAISVGTSARHYKALRIAELTREMESLNSYSDEALKELYPEEIGKKQRKENREQAQWDYLEGKISEEEYTKIKKENAEPSNLDKVYKERTDRKEELSDATKQEHQPQLESTYVRNNDAVFAQTMLKKQRDLELNDKYNKAKREFKYALATDSEAYYKQALALGLIGDNYEIDQFKKEAYKDDTFSLWTFTTSIENLLYNCFIDVLFWLYQVIVLIRLFMGNVFMCVMLYFFPLVFLAMMFDRYKGAFGSWIVTYVELALWQPIATIIVYCSCEIMKNFCTGEGVVDSIYVILVIIATIFAASEIGTYAKYAMTAFNGSGGNSSGKSGLSQLKGLIR